MKIIKRLTFLTINILLISILLFASSLPLLAETAPYYKGFNIVWSPSVYYGSYSWKTGLWPFRTQHQEYYYMTQSHYRCLTYYHDSWIQNQGQTVTITTSKTVSRTVENTVSAELGLTGTIKVIEAAGKAGYSHSRSTTTTYSTSLGLSYNMKDYPLGQYRIASMGYIDRFSTNYYKEGNYQYTYTGFGYDHDYGQVITLVRR